MKKNIKMPLIELVKEEGLSVRAFAKKYNIKYVVAYQGKIRSYIGYRKNSKEIEFVTTHGKTYCCHVDREPLIIPREPLSSKQKIKRKREAEYNWRKRTNKYNQMAHTLPATSVIHEWLNDR